MAETASEWLRPEGGFTAWDLDQIPGLPRHTELIDGALIFMSPQTRFHMRMLYLLESTLRAWVPTGFTVVREMSVLLGERQRPEPDLAVIDSAIDTGERETSYPGESVVLAIEVVSPDSVERDRKRKPMLYATAGIRHFWRVEEDGGRPVVFVYELDEATGAYVASGVHRDKLQLSVPFPVETELDLTDL